VTHRRGIGRDVLHAVLAIILLVAVVAVLRPISALLFAPWAIGIDGGPTLTGTWVGPMRSKWGSEY
jgi:hypothetical protein